ncbi:hypothetical protein AB7C87_22010 [Natrarchaeobius sp. A-rgal3]|uniref:hypothetical protein n=1 Tax=Natrarchaeobius versutus TaxID=1679078 RepID=UPI00350EE797
MEDDTTDDFEPDIERQVRLGDASPISAETTSETHFDTERAARKSVSIAAERVQNILDDNGYLQGNIEVGNGTVDLDDPDFEMDDQPRSSEFNRDLDLGVMVFYLYHYSKEGELLSKPEITFDELLDAVPRSAEIQLNFEENEYTAILPVVCYKEWEKAQSD